MVERKSLKYWLLALALLLTVFYLFPLVLVGMNSVKTTGEFTTNPFSLPTRLVTENYPQAYSQMHSQMSTSRPRELLKAAQPTRSFGSRERSMRTTSSLPNQAG